MGDLGYPTVSGDAGADDSSSESEAAAPAAAHMPKTKPQADKTAPELARDSDSESESDTDDSEYTVPTPCMAKPTFELDSDDSSDDSEVDKQLDEMHSGGLTVSETAVLSEDDSEKAMSDFDEGPHVQKIFKAPVGGTGINSYASLRLGTGALLGKTLFTEIADPSKQAKFVVPLLRMLAGRETDEELEKYVRENCQPMCGPLAHCALGPTLIEAVESLSWEGDPGDDEARAAKQEELEQALQKRVLEKDKKTSKLSKDVVAHLREFATMASETSAVDDSVVYNGHILKTHFEQHYPTQLWGRRNMLSNDGVLQGDVHVCAMEGLAALFATDEFLCREPTAEKTDCGRKKRMIAEQGDGTLVSAQETVVNMLLRVIRSDQKNAVSSPAEIFRQQIQQLLSEEENGAKSSAGDVCGFFSGFGNSNEKLAYGDDFLHPDIYRRLQARVLNAMRRDIKEREAGTEEDRVLGSVLNRWR